MQPLHTLKINPACSKASPLPQCGFGHQFTTAERWFLMIGQSSLLLILLKGLWEEKDFLTLSVLASQGAAPHCLPLWTSTPPAGEAEVAQKMLKDQCQGGCLLPVAPLELLLAQLWKHRSWNREGKVRKRSPLLVH